MPLSTSNSEDYIVREIPDRPLAGIVSGCMIAVLGLLAVLEVSARRNGVLASRDRNMVFWQNHRLSLDSQASDTTVCLGASRITFGIDQDQWEDITGERPYNLGLWGASSLPMLNDCAENTSINGKVLCSLSGGFAFANEKIPFSFRISKAIQDLDRNRYSFTLRSKDWTGPMLQARFAVLNPAIFSPVEILRENLRFSTRPNEIAWFHIPYTVHHTEENQDIFIDDLSDPYYLHQWDTMHQTALEYMARFEPRDLDIAIAQIIKNVKQIEARGGEVIFVNFPVSRFFKEWENQRFPREKYWDEIIEQSGCRGFHYLDHEKTKDLSPPDGSHLMPDEAKIFTRELAKFVNE
ncbi:hypothetical protein OAF34_01215 [Pirellulaceae bacterium]|nr:hypothetical protein [Pirellulaceae bacterium]